VLIVLPLVLSGTTSPWRFKYATEEKMFYHQLVFVRDVVEMLLKWIHKAQFCLSAIAEL
jgi:hypothetical protein